jgi:hypothetical protein
MAIDPGGATGVAWGVFDLKGGSFEEAMLGREHDGSKTLSGSEESQIRQLAVQWMLFYRRCVEEHGLGPGDVELVCENFVPQPGKAHTEEGVISIRIIWGLIGYRMGAADEYDRGGWGPVAAPQMVLQMAETASTFAKSDRLRKWGCWVRGKEHERSAWKHICARLSHLRKLHSS